MASAASTAVSIYSCGPGNCARRCLTMIIGYRWHPVIRRSFAPSISLPRPSPENLPHRSVGPAGPTTLCRSAPTRVRFFRSGNRRLCVGPRTGKPSYAVHRHRPFAESAFSARLMGPTRSIAELGRLLTRQRCRVKPASGTEV